MAGKEGKNETQGGRVRRWLVIKVLLGHIIAGSEWVSLGDVYRCFMQTGFCVQISVGSTGLYTRTEAYVSGLIRTLPMFQDLSQPCARRYRSWISKGRRGAIPSAVFSKNTWWWSNFFRWAPNLNLILLKTHLGRIINADSRLWLLKVWFTPSRTVLASFLFNQHLKWFWGSKSRNHTWRKTNRARIPKSISAALLISVTSLPGCLYSFKSGWCCVNTTTLLGQDRLFLK